MGIIETTGLAMALVGSSFGGYLIGDGGCNGHHLEDGTWQPARTEEAHIKYEDPRTRKVVITREKHYKCKDCGKIKTKREKYDSYNRNETR